MTWIKSMYVPTQKWGNNITNITDNKKTAVKMWG